MKLAQARAAYARQEWATAAAAFKQLAPLGVADLERLAWASVLAGQRQDSASALEALYNLHLEAEAFPQAARAALWLTLQLSAGPEASRASGWLVRAQRLLGRETKACVEHGYLSLPMAQRSLASGDFKAAHDAAAAAAACGDRFGDPDLASFARHLQGRALLKQGRLEEGLLLLDEAMVAVTGGELSPLVAGLVYCGAIAACQQVNVLGRAREWTTALTAWCDRQPQLAMFAGACLVHRAEVKMLSGAWPEALAEARRAAAMTSDPARGDALYQEAEIHRLRGEEADAEGAYLSAGRLGREPQPGLSLLRLAQGKQAMALSGIQRSLEATRDPLQRAKLLPAAVEIALAAGEPDQARRASEELDGIAAAFPSELLGALAADARGAVLLAAGDASGALRSLRASFKIWMQAGTPHLAARTRVLVAAACGKLGDEDGAALELDAARRAFVELAAAPDLARLGVAAKPHGLTPRELEVLRLVASGKTNKEIAKALFLSEKTVDRHASNLFDKAGVRTRAGLTAFAYQNKLV